MAKLNDDYVFNEDTIITAKMRLKMYTVTIQSGKSNGESKTYSVEAGGIFSFPSCPFSPDSDAEFVNYNCNGSTYSVGNKLTITSNVVVNCNWKKKPRHLKMMYKIEDGFFYHKLIEYSDSLDGKSFEVLIRFTGGQQNFDRYLNRTDVENWVRYDDIISVQTIREISIYLLGKEIHQVYGTSEITSGRMVDVTIN